MTLAEIEQIILKQRSTSSDFEPLITFPTERHLSRQYYKDQGKSSGYHWAEYIDAVWEHAAKLIAIATEIRVIGYSFNPIDSRYVISDLLDKTTCQKIMIQNKDPKSVERNLAHYAQFSGRLEFDSTPF